MSSARTTAQVAGIFFVLTFLAGIPAPLLYGPVLDPAASIISAGADTSVRWGAFLEVLLVIANVGTAVVLFPIVKRQHESIALGYVATRVLESTLIVVGMVSVLSLVTLRQDLAGVTGADAAAFVTVGTLLVTIHDWLSLFGPAYCAGFGNGLLLGYLLYRSRLVPRGLALLGLFGVFERSSGPALLVALPEIAWGASLGIYLIVKGFKPAAMLRDTGAP